MRLFLAVVPPVDVLDHLDLALAAARSGPAGADGSVRWSARETWHLTAAFYGELPDASVVRLVDALAEVLAARPGHRLALRGAGMFAHRTLWVGAGGDVEGQRALASAATAAGERVGARPDRRDRNRAHLTVGRATAGGGPPRRPRAGRPVAAPGGPTGAEAIAQALAVYQGPSWTVSGVHLIRSQPGAGRGGGPLYTSLAELPTAAEGSGGCGMMAL